MALDPLVTAEDLERWLTATFDASAAAKAGAVVAAASALVRSEAGVTWEGMDLPDQVRVVTLQVAARVFTNPNGVVQESIGSYSVQYADPEASGLFLTASEKAMLGRLRANARGLWSLSITRDDPAADTAWVPVVGTDTLFPWYAGDVAR